MKIIAVATLVVLTGVGAFAWAGTDGPLRIGEGAGAVSKVDLVAPKPKALPSPEPPAPVYRDSRSLGSPSAGSLVRGVQLPVEGLDFFTWDPIITAHGNRPWRRHGTDELVRRRPRGGDFGPRFGLPGHASHQNGLDVDLYYPRRDRLERAPTKVGQIDLALSQDLVNRFVAAGAERVFVGPATGLRGPAPTVVPLIHHDNHLHVRFPAGVG